MLKSLRKGMLATFVATLGSGYFGSVATAETLTYATWQPEASQDLHALSMHWFADELEKRTDGEHELRIFWGGTLAGIAEIGDAVENGLADAGDLVVPYHPDQLPVNNAIGFFWPQPHSPRDLAEMMKEFHETIPQFSEELSRFNMKLIGLRPLGYYGILCREPVRSMADFAGRRIRSYGVALPAAIQAIGGVPVSMSTVETYEALERGVLDCTPIEPVIARGQKYDEVAKYFIDVPLGASWGQYIVLNTDVYDGLPDDLRETLDQLGEEYHTYFADEQELLTAETMAVWEARDDFEVITIPAEDFLSLTENDDNVKAARQQWIERAEALGVDAEMIANRMAFE
jgi:TRAP-type C4-dicarboxylate transport system substrate-binding protein